MNKKQKHYTLTKQQRIVLTILKEIETSEYGKSICEVVLQDECYSESKKGFLNILRESFIDELKERFDSTFQDHSYSSNTHGIKLEDVNGNKFTNNTFTNVKGYVMGIDTATGQSTTAVRTYSNLSLPKPNLYVNSKEVPFILDPNLTHI